VVAGALVVVAGIVVWSSGALPGPDHQAPGTPVTITGATPVTDVRGARVSAGFLPTRLVIPALDLDEPVLEVGIVERAGSLEWETVRNAVGHHIDSARPGQPGNMVLTGHVAVASAGDRAVFRSLAELQVGQELEVFAGEERHRYVVEDMKIVASDEVNVLRSDIATELTLVTCTPDLIDRLIVRGIHVAM